MKIEIWSDLMCPFCYIGKRRFENALSAFAGREDVQVEWKSYLLNPQLKSDAGKSSTEYLMEVKGWTREQVREANAQVVEMAASEGLHYELDKTILANTYDAHRLVQLAKLHGLGAEMEERLFKAYFTEGKNLADSNTLENLGVEIGLKAVEIQKMFSENLFEDLVETDIYEAQQIGVRSVPFFVFNDKYAVSGAQPTEVFAGALEKSLAEWKLQM
mgnify:CR=1 FL=1